MSLTSRQNRKELLISTIKSIDATSLPGICSGLIRCGIAGGSVLLNTGSLGSL